MYETSHLIKKKLEKQNDILSTLKRQLSIQYNYNGIRDRKKISIANMKTSFNKVC